MSDDDTRTTLGRDSRITIGLLVTLSAMLLAFHTWLDSRLDGIEQRLLLIEQTTTTNRWTRSNQADWAEDLRRRNPEIDVPTVTRSE